MTTELVVKPLPPVPQMSGPGGVVDVEVLSSRDDKDNRVVTGVVFEQHNSRLFRSVKLFAEELLDSGPLSFVMSAFVFFVLGVVLGDNLVTYLGMGMVWVVMWVVAVFLSFFCDDPASTHISRMTFGSMTKPVAALARRLRNPDGRLERYPVELLEAVRSICEVAGERGKDQQDNFCSGLAALLDDDDYADDVLQLLHTLAATNNPEAAHFAHDAVVKLVTAHEREQLQKAHRLELERSNAEEVRKALLAAQPDYHEDFAAIASRHDHVFLGDEEVVMAGVLDNKGTTNQLRRM